MRLGNAVLESNWGLPFPVVTWREQVRWYLAFSRGGISLIWDKIGGYPTV
jgi:hypothetical protein